MHLKTGQIAGTLIVLFALSALAYDRVNDGLEPFPPSMEVEKSTSSAKKPPSSFVTELADRLNLSVNALAKLEKDGFGRSEMIRFSLIAQKSEKSWEQLVKQRNKGEPLRKMAEEAGADYLEIFRSAERMRDEIATKVDP